MMPNADDPTTTVTRFISDREHRQALREAAADNPATIVIFRVDRGIRGSVFALMPESPADEKGLRCTSYEHVGQHGAADYLHCIAISRPATLAEYNDLLAELTRIGYRVVIRRRATYAMHQRRQAEARS
jgi:hypothetical protein